MSYFDQYEPYVVQAANQYSIPVPILNGLIQQESSFNPFASNGSSSAYGFTQLLSGTAHDLGVNPYDPIANIFGGAKYLASMPGMDWATKLAHYYQGPAATIKQSGIDYANSVLNKATSFAKDAAGFAKTVASGAACISGDPAACASAAGSVFGGSSGSTDWVTEIKDWIASTGFFQRIALALVALLLILGAIYTLKGK